MGSILSQHWTDDALDAKTRRRTVRNWANYRTPAGLWAPTTLEVRRADGETFLGRPLEWLADRQPLQFFVGDSASAGGRPWWGVRRSEDEDAGIVLFMPFADASSGYAVNGAQKSATWADVQLDTDLKLQVSTHKIEKWVTLKSPQAGDGGLGDRFTLGFVLPAGWTLEVLNNATAQAQLSIRRQNGAEVYRSRPPQALDANGSNVPCGFVDQGSDVLGGVIYHKVRVRIIPGDAVYPIEVDPTIVVSGTSAIEDAEMIDIVPTYNYGGRNLVAIGTQAPSYRSYGLMRFATGSLPPGTVTDATLWGYRDGYETTPRNCAIWPIAAANTWVEGTASGSTQAGSSCWGHTKYNTQAWAGLAGCDLIDTDTVTGEASSWSEYGAATGIKEWFAMTLTPAWIEKWRDGIWTNNGILFRWAQYVFSGVMFGSSFRSTEHSSGNDPYLSITYTLGYGRALSRRWL